MDTGESAHGRNRASESSRGLKPPDLFTKHLPSGEKIASLIQLFSCEFRTGRAESAPQLRRITCQNNVGAIRVEGEFEESKSIKGVDSMGETREAEAHDPSVLPHHYDDDAIDAMFPKVEAGEADDDQFPDYCPDECPHQSE